MNTLEEAVKYFKGNDGYNRLFNVMKEKYVSLGEIKGNVFINNPTQLEKQAFSGLMKKDYSRNSSISINLKKLQQRLDESRFSGIELIVLIKEYFKEEILTKREVTQKGQNELNLFWQEILKYNENKYIYMFLAQSIEKKDSLYQNIKRYYKKHKENLKQELLNACDGVNLLQKYDENRMIRIPVFASKLTLNPHGLDKNTLCGKLFLLLLCYTSKKQYPQNSEEIAELYYNNHLLIDDISSMVLCKNITGFIKKEKATEYGMEMVKYEQHKGLYGFDKYNEPMFLTLYNLSNLAFIDDKNKYKKVVITENPAVFMGVLEKCKIKDFPLVCTYGQVKLAGIMLMDLLVKQNYQLFYSGDIDPEGIQIADKLKQRYKDKLTFLGFNTDVYYKNISNIELSPNRIQKLNNVKSEELFKLCNEIKKQKKASYEEENIEYISKFIETQFF